MRPSNPSILRPQIAVVLTVALAACNSFTGSDARSACPQTYEFGNYGCARLVAILDGPPQPWPASTRWSTRVHSADPALWLEAFGLDPADGRVPFELTLWTALPHGRDTASVWVVAKLLEDPRPIVVGVPLPIFAADSALHLAQFAAVGEQPRADTIRLTLSPLATVRR
jgi:hypothetical protein